MRALDATVEGPQSCSEDERGTMHRPRDLVVLLACLLILSIYFTAGLVVMVKVADRMLDTVQAEVSGG